MSNDIPLWLRICSVFKNPKKQTPPISLPEKDPMDWRLTPSSSEWSTDQYCPQCKHSTTHREHMSDICNNCGYFGDMQKYRSYRKIFKGGEWVYQYKYGNGPKDFEIVEI